LLLKALFWLAELEAKTPVLVGKQYLLLKPADCSEPKFRYWENLIVIVTLSIIEGQTSIHEAKLEIEVLGNGENVLEEASFSV
jgi:hypothetical protein